MSVEKFNPCISGEIIPYTQVNTQVIQNIRDIEAGFIWMYLLTMPKNWTVVKAHIKNKYGIGDNKIKRIFAYLKRCNLIEYVRERDETGKLRKSEIRVLNGSRFNDSTTGMENHPLVNQTSGKQATTNNINKTNKTKSINKPSCSSDDEPQFFDDFYKHYPRNQNRKAALKIWKRKKFDQIATLLVNDVKNRLNGEWKNKPKEFIPLASTYLNGERWTDELLQSPDMAIKESPMERAFRLCLN